MSQRSLTGKQVFVLNMDYYDFGPAREYGDLVPVTTGKIDLERIEQIREEITEVFVSKATKYDYLLVSGPPIIVAIGVSKWIEMFGFDAVFLFWDAGMREYTQWHVTDGVLERSEV